MRTLTSFSFLSLNGYYKGENDDRSWHCHGEEEGKYSEQSLSADNTLLFGRTTYELMSNFWPTTKAAEMFPAVAAGMNRANKIVFSNSLKTTEWDNTSMMSGDIVKQIRQLKSSKGNDLTILGSGSIVSQFSDAGLIDNYQIMIDPVGLSRGTPLFEGMQNQLDLKLIDSKVFKSGVVLLTYTKL